MTVSIHLVTPTAVLKPGSASSPGVVAWDHPSSHGDLCPKTEFFFPISAEEKGASGFRVLASFFFFTLTGDSFGLSLFIRVRLWSTDSLTYILISSFNGQPLGPVNSNTEGLGKFLISLLSVGPRDTDSARFDLDVCKSIWSLEDLTLYQRGKYPFFCRLFWCHADSKKFFKTIWKHIHSNRLKENLWWHKRSCSYRLNSDYIFPGPLGL